jgi:anti-anti-sigma factor
MQVRFPVEVVDDVPVVAVPEEIDITNAAGLRAALHEAASHGNGTLVVDMSRTQFCDLAALGVLVRVHKQAEADGGELLLVIRGAAVRRILAVTGIDHLIPNFPSLDEALAQTPAVSGSPPLPEALAATPLLAADPDGLGRCDDQPIPARHC